MKFAHIGPPRHAYHLAKGEYHLVLAHWLFSTASYREYYTNAIRPDGTEVLLDTGAFEGQRVNVPQLLLASDSIHPDVLVLPDVLYDPRSTLIDSRECVLALAKHEGWQPSSVMFIPQAVTKKVWLACLVAWLSWWDGKDLPYRLMVGVTAPRKEKLPPKQWAEAYVRAEVLEVLSGIVPSSTVHLLGMVSVREFVDAELKYPVYGIDSSYAFTTAWARQLITPDTVKRNLRAVGTLKRYGALQTLVASICKINQAVLSEWARGGGYIPGYPFSALPLLPALTQEALREYLPPGWYTFDRGAHRFYWSDEPHRNVRDLQIKIP